MLSPGRQTPGDGLAGLGGRVGRNLPRMETPQPAPDADALTPTGRTTLKRLPERGRFDRATVHAILDEALICHLGFVHDGQPFVVPTIHARVGETVYVHGAVASRMLRTLAGGSQACLTATLVDGLVVARSGFHSSMNYRSVMILGVPRLVETDEEREAALDALVDHVVAGRSAEVRRPTRVELRQTSVLALDLTEGSAKVRTGGPIDDEADLDGPAWAGVVPLRLTTAGPPVPAVDLAAEVPMPPSVLRLYGR